MGPVYPREARDHPTVDHRAEEDREVRVEDHPEDPRETHQEDLQEDRLEARQVADTSVQEVAGEVMNPQAEEARWKALNISSAGSPATPSCRS